MEPRSLEDLKAECAEGNVTKAQWNRGESFPSVLRRHFPEKTIAQRYELFFRAFPETSFCHSGYVLGIWDHEVVEESDAEAPYNEGDWTDKGVTSWMIGELGMLMKRTVYVIHNDRKVYIFHADMDTNDTAIVYNVWNDHFLLYRHAVVGKAASLLPLKPKLDPPLIALATRHDESEARVRWGTSFLDDTLVEALALSIYAKPNARKADILLQLQMRPTRIADKRDGHFEFPRAELLEIVDLKTGVYKDDTSLWDIMEAKVLRNRFDALPACPPCADEDFETVYLPFCEESSKAMKMPVDKDDVLLLLAGHPLILYDLDLEKLRKELQLNGLPLKNSYASPKRSLP